MIEETFSEYSNVEEDFINDNNIFKRLVLNTVSESNMVGSDENSKTYELRYYNSNIDETLLIRFLFDEKKDCIGYRFL